MIANTLKVPVPVLKMLQSEAIVPVLADQMGITLLFF